jgi:hypothetical protein
VSNSNGWNYAKACLEMLAFTCSRVLEQNVRPYPSIHTTLLFFALQKGVQ